MLNAADRAKVRVRDLIVDRMMDKRQVEAVPVRGRTRVGVWSGSHAWENPYLNFIDPERRTFCRVRDADAAPSMRK